MTLSDGALTSVLARSSGPFALRERGEHHRVPVGLDRPSPPRRRASRRCVAWLNACCALWRLLLPSKSSWPGCDALVEALLAVERLLAEGDIVPRRRFSAIAKLRPRAAARPGGGRGEAASAPASAMLQGSDRCGTALRRATWKRLAGASTVTMRPRHVGRDGHPVLLT
jgi:hypothetical protein